MAFVAQIFLYVLITACFVAVFVFLTRAIIARLAISKDAFNVARLAARRKMMQSALGAIAFLILGLIFFVIVLLFPFGDVGGDETVVADEPEGTAVVVSESDTANTDVSIDEVPVNDEAGATAEPTLVEAVATATTVTIATVTPVPTIVPPTPTAEPTATVLPTVEPLQALVNSPVVGLYVREVPGGEILERLEDQTTVTVLGEEQTIDNLVWVLVESPNGFVGWVAQEFLVLESGTEN